MAVAETAEEYLADLRGQFGWVEYVVFGLVLCMSLAIGIFFGFFSKREKNNDEFLMGGRSMSAWPVALSIMCSFVSALTVLGNPVETYQYGSQYLIVILCFLPITLILQYVYAPVYFKLQLTSGYEYFELRFNRTVRNFLSSIHCFYLIFYMALVVYGPSLALNQVTGFNTILSVALIFVICIFYSTLGGFRAVIWTDALQGVIMIISVLVVAIKGTVDVGGFGAIWDKLSDSGRLSFFRFDPDPRTRHSVWSVVFGGSFLYLNQLAGMQANIQRYSSMPNMQTVKKALWFNFFFLTIIIFLCTYSGVVIFAKFYTCDPIKANLVDATDQIFPLFVMDIVGHIPGLPGLFVAGLTCASLSSVSSALNAMAAIVMEDYVIKLKPNLTDKTKFNLSRVICLVTGIISFAFIFVVRLMGEIFPAAVSLIGILISPTFGCFGLGMLFPFANSLGALLGVIASYALSFIIGVGSVIAGANGDLPDQTCSVSTEDCTEFFLDTSHLEFYNHSMSPADTWKDRDDSGYIQFVSTSYLFFPVIGTFATIIFGLIFSWFVHILGLDKDEKVVKRDCLTPIVRSLWERLFPEQMARLISDDNNKPISPDKKLSLVNNNEIGSISIMNLNESEKL